MFSLPTYKKNLQHKNVFSSEVFLVLLMKNVFDEAKKLVGTKSFQFCTYGGAGGMQK